MPAERPYTIAVVEEPPTKKDATWCPKCGGATWHLMVVHAPRVTERGLVDCVGDEVKP